MSRVPAIREAEQAITLREDLNVGQLGLISIQRKIAEDYAQWKVAFSRNGVSSEIECNGTQKYGVPHGIDNDTYLALQELYIEQGCPDDGLFSFTMYRLLQMCGLFDTGANRQMLRVSLERLSSTQYWISGAWRSHEDDDWVTVSFRLIEKLVFTRARRDTDGAKQIAITLPHELTRNIHRSGDIDLHPARP
ncbi:replication initiator protein A [Deinococcus psychrotolerans]|uniref:replication initiator protein A n=1 Tax=Deinococcus psychrotolerans TaxID=2489213 RepID=UPI001F156F37|nr:replication initiator protein A [Deinococcus psychrotolerans]